MVATTYELIQKNILGSSAASVTFSSIPATYDDLLVVVSGRSDRSEVVDIVTFRFNGAANDTNLSGRRLTGNGSSAASASYTYFRAGLVCGNTSASDTFGTLECYLPNYAGSTNKSGSSTSAFEDNASRGDIEAAANLWSDTSAITQIEVGLTRFGADFMSGSSFFLYGITKA